MPPKTFCKKKEWPSTIDDQGAEFHVHSYLKCEQCHQRIRVGFGGWSNLLDMHVGSKNCKKKMRRAGAPVRKKAPSQPTESEVFLRTLAGFKHPGTTSKAQSSSFNAPILASAASHNSNPPNALAQQEVNQSGHLRPLVQAILAPE